MKKLLAVLFALVFAFAAFGRPALADHPGEGGAPFRATLTGAAEFPGPGHPTGAGTALLRLNPGQEEICFDIETSGLTSGPNAITRFTGAHIHIGSPTEAGRVVVGLVAPDLATGASSGCVFAPREVIIEIIQNPENYYVNVHGTPGFGPGAIRGQLEGPGRS